MLITTYASAVHGVDAKTITIEVNTGKELSRKDQLRLNAGQPDSGLQRIESAIVRSKFSPLHLKHTVSTTPSDIRTDSAVYDLPTAVGMLVATNQIQCSKLENYVIVGELSPDGSLRSIKGALPIAIQSRAEKFKGLILPKQNAREAAIVNSLNVYGVENLLEAVGFLAGTIQITPTQVDTRQEFADHQEVFSIDFSDIPGQANVKRSLAIAAAGRHHTVLIGPPAAGKLTLAQRMPTILPSITLYEALETTKIHSVCGLLPADTSLVSHRPFRAPHHTISDEVLVGGDLNPLSGEVSLAHNGVLFLDELPEFKLSVLNRLLQPMEDRRITTSQGNMTLTYVADFMLIAAMNFCPCGYYNHPDRECVCSPAQIHKYVAKIPRSFLDHIDLHVEVSPHHYEMASVSKPSNRSSKGIRDRVTKARIIQNERFKKHQDIFCNAHMTIRMVREVCQLNIAEAAFLKKAMQIQKLPARAYNHILKIARTCADMTGSKKIQIEHLAEAIQYRSLDKEGQHG